MANTDKIFKPRRGTKSNFSSTGNKSNIVLDTGEVFFEVPDTGQGTGRVRVKMGDGITQYSSLPYAIPFTEDEIIIHNGTDTKTISASSSIQSSSIATNLNNAKSGNTLKSIIHNLREAIYKCACDISYLNTAKQAAGSYAAANHNHDSVYQAKGSYAAADHNHSGVYQPVGSYAAANHSHSYGSISGRMAIMTTNITLKARDTAIAQASFSAWASTIPNKIAFVYDITSDSVSEHFFCGYEILYSRTFGNPYTPGASYGTATILYFYYTNN